MKRIFSTLFISLALMMVANAQAPVSGAQTAATDVVMVLPFENTSGRPEFNWVGESFSASLSELLRVPGLSVVGNDQRKIIQQRLRVPLASIPSLATSLKLARESGATMLVSGTYNIVPAQGDSAATITVTVKTIRVNEGRFISETIDGKQITRDINLTDALGNLQSIQGQVAYQLLYQRDKSLPFSQNQLIEASSKVPGRAFEAYIKGLLTQALDSKENFFKNAVRLYAESTNGGVYADASIELGHLYLTQRKLSDASDAFGQVINDYQKCREAAKTEGAPSSCSDDNFAEASFYLGLVQWRQGNLESALGVLRPLAEDLKLTTVYNTLGVIAVQASRVEKKNPGKSAALLNEGIDLLKKASESAPDDANVRFNYAVALFLTENYTDSATQVRTAIVGNPRDGDAYFLLAKALEISKDQLAPTVDDQAKQYLTAGNRYAKLETEWQRSKTINDIQLRVEQPDRKNFVAVILSRRQAATPVQAPVSETEALLENARSQVKNGQDDEAMATLRKILASEPMNAESYMLLGKIHLRRGDVDQAVSSFKTSIFWDAKMIDSHVALGKIYVEKGDCQQAKTFSASALEIDQNNADAMALQRLAERCSK